MYCVLFFSLFIPVLFSDPRSHDGIAFAPHLPPYVPVVFLRVGFGTPNAHRRASNCDHARFGRVRCDSLTDVVRSLRDTSNVQRVSPEQTVRTPCLERERNTKLVIRLRWYVEYKRSLEYPCVLSFLLLLRWERATLVEQNII